VDRQITGEVIGRVPQGTEEDVLTAIERAQEGFRKMSSLTAYERYSLLMKAADLLRSRSEEFARTLVLEVGKTIREARAEVARAVQTLIFSAEEAKRIGGETFPPDAHPNGAGKVGFYIRVPAGLVSAITPFNFGGRRADNPTGGYKEGCPRTRIQLRGGAPQGRQRGAGG